MSAHELRYSYVQRVQQEVFGKDWRADQPIESLAGLIADLIEKAAAGNERAQAIAVKIKTLTDSIKVLGEVYGEINNLTRGR